MLFSGLIIYLQPAYGVFRKIAVSVFSHNVQRVCFEVFQDVFVLHHKYQPLVVIWRVVHKVRHVSNKLLVDGAAMVPRVLLVKEPLWLYFFVCLAREPQHANLNFVFATLHKVVVDRTVKEDVSRLHDELERFRVDKQMRFYFGDDFSVIFALDIIVARGWHWNRHVLVCGEASMSVALFVQVPRHLPPCLFVELQLLFDDTRGAGSSTPPVLECELTRSVCAVHLECRYLVANLRLFRAVFLPSRLSRQLDFLLLVRDYFLLHLEYRGLFLIGLGPVLVNCAGVTHNDALAAHLHDRREDVKGLLCGFEFAVRTRSNVCVLVGGVHHQFLTVFEALAEALSEDRKRKQHEPQAMPRGEAFRGPQRRKVELRKVLGALLNAVFYVVSIRRRTCLVGVKYQLTFHLHPNRKYEASQGFKERFWRVQFIPRPCMHSPLARLRLTFQTHVEAIPFQAYRPACEIYVVLCLYFLLFIAPSCIPPKVQWLLTGGFGGFDLTDEVDQLRLILDTLKMTENGRAGVHVHLCVVLLWHIRAGIVFIDAGQRTILESSSDRCEGAEPVGFIRYVCFHT